MKEKTKQSEKQGEKIVTLQPRLTLREKKNLFYIHIPVSEREKFCLRLHSQKGWAENFPIPPLF